ETKRLALALRNECLERRALTGSMARKMLRLAGDFLPQPGRAGEIDDESVDGRGILLRRKAHRDAGLVLRPGNHATLRSCRSPPCGQVRWCLSQSPAGRAPTALDSDRARNGRKEWL